MIALGDRYEDEVTGFVGTATARTETLGLGATVCLETIGSDGRPDDVWLPEIRLRPANGDRKVGIRRGGD